MAAESGFDVSDRDFGVGGGEGTRKGRGGVTLDDDQVRLLLGENYGELGEHSSGEVFDGLVFLHQFEIDVGGESKCGEDLVDHFAVLTGITAADLESWDALQGVDHGC